MSCLNLCLNKFHNFLRICFQNINMVLEGFQYPAMSSGNVKKISVDNSKTFGAFLAGLFKAFDCFDPKLLIAKLNAYGFSLTELKLVHNYLSNRKKWPKINSSYSSLLEILFGIPHGSILGPLLYNTFFNWLVICNRGYWYC